MTDTERIRRLEGQVHDIEIDHTGCKADVHAAIGAVRTDIQRIADAVEKAVEIAETHGPINPLCLEKFDEMKETIVVHKVKLGIFWTAAFLTSDAAIVAIIWFLIQSALKQPRSY